MHINLFVYICSNVLKQHIQKKFAILFLPTILDPIFSLTGGLEKVYRRFCERPDGPLPESVE